MLLLFRFKAKLLILLLSLLVSSCGFSYKYARIAQLEKEVYVDQVYTVYGSMLRNRLNLYFSDSITEQTKYILKPEIDISIVKSNTDQDGFATSKIIYINVDWSIYDINTGELIRKDRTSSVVRYTFRDLNYVNNQDEVSSINSAIIAVAKRVVDDVSVGLESKGM